MAGGIGDLCLRHPPSLARTTVHAPAAGRRVVFLAAFVALHSVTLKVCLDTSGQAYEAAVEKVRKINREHHLNGTKPEDRPPQDPLPSTWAPNPWASAALFVSVSLHALFHLLCHWKVSLKAAWLYKRASAVREGCYVQVTPLPHRGKPALVPITNSEASLRLCFVFQRQRYEYWEPADDADEEDDGTVGEVRLVQCPVENPLASYMDTKGLESSDRVEELMEHFGENQLAVDTPSFIECYKEQLLTPLVIFQVFVALLWMADDFIQYTLMQIVFILVFESTSVMQRLRTFKMLNSMGTKPYAIQVYRSQAWVEVSTADLLPGDIVELTATRAPPPPKDGEAPKEEEKFAPDIVPCDCVIIRGEAVANEASLTGESAPQMKDALNVEDRALELQGRDRVHSLFSGTQLLRSSEGSGGKKAEDESGKNCGAPKVPRTPHGGCLCYVVRTGFASSQGELLQMIEFSQEKVSGDTKEVIVALFVLLAFALAAAGYVLKTGLEKGEKTPHELLLKCVIILTAVVPRQLPMQMAVAVNTALMALIKAGVYCTEPFRVPLAGKLTHCLFDKTGTLTTDTLIPVSVVNNGDGKPASADGYPDKVAVGDASPASAMILAACHSLVGLDGKLVGDPIEEAALQGVGWSYDAEAEKASPKITVADSQDSNTPALPRREESPINDVHILQRFHFASHLQRMAVIVKVNLRTAKVAGLDGPGHYCLVKGSPEALRPLLAEGATPPWFEKAHLDLAEHGLRVLALAFRRLTEADVGKNLSRDEAERELHFAGFIAFECLSRADSALVVGALRESDHQVAMLTGDSPLTALHIARTCGITDGDRPGLLLKLCESGASQPDKKDQQEGGSQEPVAEWVVATGDKRGTKHPLSEQVDALSLEFTLMATGDALDAAVRRRPELWAVMTEIRVFARMTPQGKAEVIRELQKQGRNVLMCGDGGNDVGALKQADVGLALLAGHGNVNTSDAVSVQKKQDDTGDQLATTEENKAAETVLNERADALAKRVTKAQKDRQKFLWEKQKELNKMHKQWLEEECEKKAQMGQTGFMAQASSVKTVLARYTAELKKEMKEYDQNHCNVYDVKEEKETAEEKMKKSMEEAQAGGLPMVRPGDASVAAPFTSKAPSVKNCVDLIRQGRCTLLSALQQQQIMMLNCIINAYVLSALSLEGSRSSERQMMASHWLLTIASLAFAYASPCDRMHPVRPLRSLFHPAVFLSMLGQAAIHLFCMVTAVRMARACMDENSAERQDGWSGPALKDVSEFWRREKLKRRGLIETEEAEKDWSQMLLEQWTQPFLPNLMNTVVFLVETAQTVAILFVNYKGQPWMKGVTENRALFLSVFVVAGGVAAAAWELSPELNGLIHLSPFPNDHFRWSIMGLVFATLVGTLIWDRLCVAMFAPEVFGAMVQSTRQTTFKRDVLPIFFTAGKVLGVLFILGTGNIVFAGLAYYMYHRSKKQEEERENAK